MLHVRHYCGSLLAEIARNSKGSRVIKLIGAPRGGALDVDRSC